MKKELFMVILATGIATNRGSYGVGQAYPCENEDEAERMVLAGQATWPQVERVAKEEHDALKALHDGLVIQLEAANLALLEKPEASPEAQAKTIELTAELEKTHAEKLDAEKRVEASNKELAAVNKKLKAALAKAK